MSPKYKFSWKSYYEATPANLRKWGDIWATFWLAIAMGATAYIHPWVAIVCIVLAALGKAFSNFFTINNQTEEDKTS